MIIGAALLWRGLNGLILGEATALHLGIPVQRVTAMTAAETQSRAMLCLCGSAFVA